VRTHQLTVDGPVGNGAPGEAPTPGELVLVAVASCAAEVLQVLARDTGVALTAAAVTAQGTIDMGRQPHADVTVFSSVELDIVLHGPAPDQAAALVAGFQRRCPVYGSLAVASGRIAVHHRVRAPHSPESDASSG
jgi:uncharacterized OsmC-like protein